MLALCAANAMEQAMSFSLSIPHLPHTQSSFFWPMQVMCSKKRQAMRGLYGFCRAVDDIADGVLDVDEKHHRLDEWTAEVERVFGGMPQTGVGRMIVDTQTHFRQDKQHFLDIIAGMRMDVSGQMVCPNLDALELYCYRVASCVGLLALPIFGCHDEKDRQFAISLGHALQLTNILRDVLSDAEVGRIYLPKEWLQGVGIDALRPDEVIARTVAIRPVCRALSDKAREHYTEADNYLVASHRMRLLPALLMRDLYQRLYRRMMKDGWSYQVPYSVTVGDKLSLIYRVLVYQLAPAACLIKAIT